MLWQQVEIWGKNISKIQRFEDELQNAIINAKLPKWVKMNVCYLIMYRNYLKRKINCVKVKLYLKKSPSDVKFTLKN